MYIAIVGYDDALGERRALVVEEEETDAPARFLSVDEIRVLRRGHWMEHANWYALDIETGESEEL